MKNNGRNTAPLLKVNDLSVSYYKKDVLFGASIEVWQGEIVALVGANGSGKSTLLKTIAGVIQPNAGSIIFNGIDITGERPNELVRLGLGFLMQGSVVFPSLTVTEHLQLALQAVEKSTLDGQIETVWTIFPSLATQRNVRAGLLSGGERQMLALGMLLVQNAKLWLLDEPSGGLAPQTVRLVMDAIERINKESSVTILLAEQNLREGLRIADRVYVLKNGLTYPEEHPEEMLNNGKLEEIFFK